MERGAGDILSAADTVSEVYLIDPTTKKPMGSTTVPLVVSLSSGATDQEVVGNVAAGATDSGNPVKVGAVFGGAAGLPTLTAGQRGDLQLTSKGLLRTAPAAKNVAGADAFSNALYGLSFIEGDNATGVLVGVANSVSNGTTYDRQRGDTNATSVLPGLSSTFWNYAAATSGISNTTTAVTIKAAAGASVRNYITGIQIDATALGAATEIAIRDGAGGTVLWRGYVGTAGYPNGRSITFPNPLKGTANTLLEVVTLTASITGALYFNAQGFTGA